MKIGRALYQLIDDHLYAIDLKVAGIRAILHELEGAGRTGASLLGLDTQAAYIEEVRRVIDAILEAQAALLND